MVADTAQEAKHYQPTPAAGRTVRPGVWVELLAEHVHQDIIDQIFHVHEGGVKDPNYRDPKDTLLDREAAIDEILLLLRVHRNSKHHRVPSYQALDTLTTLLGPLGERYPHRGRDIIDGFCQMYDRKDNLSGYDIEPMMLLMAKLKYCPTAFLPLVEKVATKSNTIQHRDPAQQALAHIGPDGVAIIEKCAREGDFLPLSFIELAAQDPEFASKYAEFLPLAAEAAGWDGYFIGCGRVYQIAVSKFGPAAWPHLIEVYENPKKDARGIPRALAVIGRFEELVRDHARSPKSKRAILKAIGIAAAPAKQHFDQGCEICLAHKRLTNVAYPLLWTNLMLSDADEKVKTSAGKTLAVLRKHPAASDVTLN